MDVFAQHAVRYEPAARYRKQPLAQLLIRQPDFSSAELDEAREMQLQKLVLLGSERYGQTKTHRSHERQRRLAGAATQIHVRSQRRCAYGLSARNVGCVEIETAWIVIAALAVERAITTYQIYLIRRRVDDRAAAASEPELEARGTAAARFKRRRRK